MQRVKLPSLASFRSDRTPHHRRWIHPAYALTLSTFGASAAFAAEGTGTPIQLPTVSVEESTSDGITAYKADSSSLPKLSGPLRDTPMTVDAISRQVMDDQGATTVKDALRNVPGISLAAGESGAQGDNLTIRGFSARNDFYLDGMRDNGSYYRDPFNMKSLEALKGPASIMFGRGSTGGVIEQNSKTPTLESLTAGTVGLGTDQTKRVTVDMDRPIDAMGPGTAVRVNVMAQDGTVAGRKIAENSRVGLAPSLAMGLGTPTRFTLSYFHQSEYDIPDYGLPWVPSGTSGATIAPASLSSVGSNYYGFEHGNFLRTNVDIGTAVFEHDLNDAVTVRDQIRYGNYQRSYRITEPQILALNSSTVNRNQIYGDSTETFFQNQSDATIHGTTGWLDHTVVTGVEIGRETSDPTRNTTVASSSTTSLFSPDPESTYTGQTRLASKTRSTADTVALYAMDTIKIGRRWEILGGLRFDHFDAQLKQTAWASATAQPTYYQAHHVDDLLSWRGAVVFKPTEESSVYYGAGTSFNPSAESLTESSTNAVLSPVENISHEVGGKWDVLNDQLALSGALFQTTQVNVREADPNNALLNILAGTAEAKGYEVGLVGHLTPQWQVTAGYAYTFSAITESPSTGASSDLGHRLANTPMHTANLWSTYTLPSKLEMGGGVDYVGSRYASSTPSLKAGNYYMELAPGYVLFNAMAKYPVTEHIYVQLNVNNLTDVRYYDLLHPSHVVPGAGRTGLLTVGFQ